MTDHVTSPAFSRRRFLGLAGAGAASLALASCATAPAPRVINYAPPEPAYPEGGDYEQMYAAVYDEGYEVPAVPWQKIGQQYLRQEVADPTGQAPGTIVVDTASHHLYLVGQNGRAMRYGVGLGRAGFEWSGTGVIQWKQKWPKWTPPDEMIARDPKLSIYSADNGGMPPGLDNPLGARALYIFQGGEDTLYRLHGSPEWWSIGKSVSSGCVRFINQDIMDLYERVPNRTPILVVNGLSTV